MIVVDASAVVHLLTDRPVPTQLISMVVGEDLHAPALIDYEVVAALRGRVIGGYLDDLEAQGALDRFQLIAIERHLAGPYLGTLLELRHNFTSYDAAYVALAKALDAPLVTRDAKLLEAKRLGLDVRLFSS